MLRPMGAAGLKQVEGADDVRIDVGARIFQRVADAGLPGEMNDHRRPHRVEQREQAIAVFEHEFVRRETGQIGQQRVTATLEAGIVVGRHPVDAGHGVARQKQPVRHVEADKSGRSGDENRSGHGRIDTGLPNPLARLKVSRTGGGRRGAGTDSRRAGEGEGRRHCRMDRPGLVGRAPKFIGCPRRPEPGAAGRRLPRQRRSPGRSKSS